MSRSRQNARFRIHNVFWPLLVLGGGLVALLRALEVFPPAVADLIDRAWPVLLVLAGLALLLDQVPWLRRWASLITLVVAGALLGGIIAVAYTTRAASERSDNVVTFQHPLEAGVERLRVTVEGLQTAVQISPAVLDVPTITAQFIGSSESDVAADYAVEGETGVFTLRETQPGTLPRLEAIGRGRMTVELPLGVPVELDFRNADGTVILNLLGLSLSRLNVTIPHGDLVLTLPTTRLERRGDVVVSGGQVRIIVPEGLGLHLFTGGRTPQFLGGDYLQDPQDGSYLSRRYDDFAEQTELNLTVPGGVIEVGGGGGQ